MIDTAAELREAPAPAPSTGVQEILNAAARGGLAPVIFDEYPGEYAVGFVADAQGDPERDGEWLMSVYYDRSPELVLLYGPPVREDSEAEEYRGTKAALAAITEAVAR